MEDIKVFAKTVLEACERNGIAPAEILYSSSDGFSVRVRDGKTEDYKVSNQRSLTLRGKSGDRIGSASTKVFTPEGAEFLIRGVRESAQLIETEEQDEILPPDEHYETVCSYEPSLENVTAEEKIARAMEIDRLMHGRDDRLKPDDTVVASARSELCLMNTLGMDLRQRSNMIYAYTSALAKDKENSATGFRLNWGYRMEDIPAETIADACAEDALGKLYAGSMASGPCRVLIKNSTMAEILSTFSGIFSAENVQLGLSLLKDRLGEKIAADCVTLVDDPLLPWGIGSSSFDREGAATFRKALIENGTLCTLLHNRKTAAKDGCRTTGNAAGGGHVAPSNLFIAPGTYAFEEMLCRLGDGLYLTEVSGLHAGANPTSGDFSLLSRGFEVKGGKILRAVKQITVAGNFYTLLKDILAVGEDLIFEGSPIGSPSVLVGELNIAGEA